MILMIKIGVSHLINLTYQEIYNKKTAKQF